MEKEHAARLLAARQAAMEQEAEQATGLKALALLAQGAITVREAEAFTGLKKSFLYRLMSEGKLPFIKIGAARRIPKAALIRLMAEHLVGGEEIAER